MKPILFREDATDFNSNGIGVLFDAIRDEIIEERNGEFELYLEYPDNGTWVDEIKDHRIIRAKPSDRDDPHNFRIYDIRKSLDAGYIEVFATTKTNDLGGNLILEFAGLGTPQQLMGRALNNTLEPTDISFSSDIETESRVNWVRRNPLNCIVGEQGSLIQIFGGEIKRTDRTIYLYGRRGRDTGMVVRQGRHIEGFNINVNTKGLVTRILPFFTYIPEGKEEEVTVIGSIVDSPLVNNYPTRNIIPVDYSGEEGVTDLHSLNEHASGYFTYQNPDIDKPNVTVDVDMFQLSESEDYEQFRHLETIGLTDTITVYVPKHKVDVELKVTTLRYSSIKEKTLSLVAGSNRPTFYEQVTGGYQQGISALQKYVTGVVDGVRNVIQDTADGKNRIFRGYDEPSSDIAKENDLWYKNIGSGEVELYIFNGSIWEPLIDHGVVEMIREAQEGIDDAKESADKANQDILEAIQSAGFTSLADLTAELQTISNQAEANAQTALSRSSDALSSANNAVGVAQDASTLAGTLSGQVSDFELTVTGFTQTVNNYEGQVAQFTSDVNGLNSTVAIYETQVDEFGNTVGTYATQVSQFENTVNGLNSTVSSYQSDVNGYSAQVTSFENTLSGLNSTVSNYQSDVQGYQSQVSTLTNTVNGFNATVQRVEGDYSDLSGTVQSLGASIGVVEGQITNRVWQTDIQTAVDDIEIGGRNLFSAREYATQYPSIYGESEGALVILGTDATANKTWKIADLEANTNYVLHFSEDINNRFVIPSNIIRWDGNRAVYFKTTEGEGLELRGKFFPPDTTYPKKVFVKLEKGNKATDWTPAPEDTLQLISNVETEWKQTAQGFEQSITRVENGLDGKASLTAFNTLESAVDGTIQRIGDAEGNITQIEANVAGTQTLVTQIDADLGRLDTRVTTVADGFQVLSRQTVKNQIPTSDTGFVLFDPWSLGSQLVFDSEHANGFTIHQPVFNTNVNPVNRIYVPKTITSSVIRPGNTYTVMLEILTSYDGEAIKEISFGQIGASVRRGLNSGVANTFTETIQANSTDGFQIFFHTPGYYQIRKVVIKEGGGASQAQLSVLNDAINLRVSKGDVMSQINIEAGQTLIQSNRLYLDAESVVFSGKAFIPDAAIETLTADKITAGTINAAEINVINLNASDVVGLNSTFVTSRWNENGSDVRITGNGIITTASDNSQTYIQSGIVGTRNPSGATIGQLGYIANGGSPTYTLGISQGSNFLIRGRPTGTDINLFEIYPGSSETYIRTTQTRLSGEMFVNGRIWLQTSDEIRMSGGNIVNPYGIYFNSGGEIYTTGNGFWRFDIFNGGIFHFRVGAVAKMRIDSTRNYMYQILNMSGNQIVETSDVRLKTNIRPTTDDTLSKLSQIEYVDYQRIENGQEEQGFIAQQVRTVAPELIQEEPDGMLTYGIQPYIHFIGRATQQLAIEHENTLLVASHAYILAEQHEDDLEVLRTEVKELKEEIEELRGLGA